MTEEQLKRQVFDGLYHPTEPCGCFRDDLYPCGERPKECRKGIAGFGPNGYGIYSRRIVRIFAEAAGLNEVIR